jgi:hypothetical protein
VLGAVPRNPLAITSVIAFLKPHHFYHPRSEWHWADMRRVRPGALNASEESWFGLVDRHPEHGPEPDRVGRHLERVPPVVIALVAGMVVAVVAMCMSATIDRAGKVYCSH